MEEKKGLPVLWQSEYVVGRIGVIAKLTLADGHVDRLVTTEINLLQNELYRIAVIAWVAAQVKPAPEDPVCI